MNRKEFDNFFREKGVNLRREGFVVGEFTNEPSVIGCYEENGVWKVYRNSERQTTRITFEGSEEEALKHLSDYAIGEMQTRGKLD